MTPLAQFYMRQLLVRPQDRSIVALRDPETAQALREMLTGVHCFDVTAAMPLHAELIRMSRAPGGEGKVLDLLRTAVFLPAPKTWVEQAAPEGATKRWAVLVEAGPRAGTRATMFSLGSPPMHLGDLSTGDGTLAPGAAPLAKCVLDCMPLDTSLSMRSVACIYMVLINSSKATVCQQHEPHRGLVREIRQHKNFGQSFTLLPWHEIKLQVTKPRGIDDDEAHQNQITGQRALHFVRKFMRIRLGKLEYVTSHWRGNPALGIHQSDYRVGV